MPYWHQTGQSVGLQYMSVKMIIYYFLLFNSWLLTKNITLST